MADKNFNPAAVTGPDAASGLLPNGPVVAACAAAVIAFFAHGIAVTATYHNDPLQATMIKLGSVLPVVGPGANGPYAGHETVLLIAWLVSWPVLHFLLRRRNFEGPGWLIATLAGVGLATLLLWPPVYHLLRPS